MRYIALFSLLVSLSACATITVEDAASYERGSYIDKLHRLPAEIFVPYRKVRGRNEISWSNYQGAWYRHQTVRGDYVTLFIPHWVERHFYENPLLRCVANRRGYGQRHDPEYYCRPL